MIDALTNSRRLKDVSVRKQEQFDASTINALKRFHQDLFNVQSPGTDARSTREGFRMAMRALLASDKPDAGGLIPQANTAMAQLHKQLEQRLQQAQVLAPTAAAKADVQNASKPGTAVLRLNRYRADEVPKPASALEVSWGNGLRPCARQRRTNWTRGIGSACESPRSLSSTEPGS